MTYKEVQHMLANDFEHNGFRVEIHYDEDGGAYADPRGDDGNVGLFLGFPHRNYEIGDERIDPTDLTAECETCHGSGEVDEPTTEDGHEFYPPCPTCHGNGEVPVTDIVAYVKAKYGARVVLPVSMLDHSGVHFYVGNAAHWTDPGGWDSGLCGLIFDTEETRKDLNDNVTDDQLRDYLTQEIEQYNLWASGQIYGYVIKDQNGDTVDSCWGFLGDEHVTEEAKQAADNCEQPAKLYPCRLTDKTLDRLETGLSLARDTYLLTDPERAEYEDLLSLVKDIRKPKEG